MVLVLAKISLIISINCMYAESVCKYVLNQDKFCLRMIGPIYLILSVFSGHRRWGDVQMQFEALAAYHDILIHVVG